MVKCKWCGLLFLSEKDVEEHEEICDRNDGDRGNMNYEGVADKYFD